MEALSVQVSQNLTERKYIEKKNIITIAADRAKQQYFSFLFPCIYLLKGSVSRDFLPPFFHDSTPSGPLIKMFLINQHFMLQIFSFIIDVLTHKRISPDCLFRSNHRQLKNQLLFPRCAIYSRDHLRSMQHTAETISAVMHNAEITL